MQSLTILPPPTRQAPGLFELNKQELADWMRERGEKPMRAGQVRQWVLVRGAEAFEGMSDLPLKLRQTLTSEFTIFTTTVARHLQADDGTHKMLLRLADGNLIECVLIQDGERRTACVSTQVGCGMGCVFCASGIDGVMRNLTTGEILEQLVRLRNLPPIGTHASLIEPSLSLTRLTNIVVMGMGEPLANLDNLLAALDVATAKEGLGIGARHITISTVGLPGKIRRLADLGKQYHLAVSLHAPDDTLRGRIVPTNDKTGLDAILSAADYFFAKTGRQVTFEYVLLSGINDDVSHARQLARLLFGRNAHINLIPFNDVEGLEFRGPNSEQLAAFVGVLRQQGLSVKVRKRKGLAHRRGLRAIEAGGDRECPLSPLYSGGEGRGEGGIGRIAKA